MVPFYFYSTEEDLKELCMIEQLTLLIVPCCKARAFQKFPVSMHVCIKYISFPILIHASVMECSHAGGTYSLGSGSIIYVRAACYYRISLVMKH